MHVDGPHLDSYGWMAVVGFAATDDDGRVALGLHLDGLPAAWAQDSTPHEGCNGPRRARFHQTDRSSLDRGVRRDRLRRSGDGGAGMGAHRLVRVLGAVGPWQLSMVVDVVEVRRFGRGELAVARMPRGAVMASSAAMHWRAPAPASASVPAGWGAFSGG